MLSGMFYAPSQQYYINPVTGSYMFGNKVIDRKDYINKTAFGDIRPRPTVKINYDYVYEYKKNDPNTKINERYENISINMSGGIAAEYLWAGSGDGSAKPLVDYTTTTLLVNNDLIKTSGLGDAIRLSLYFGQVTGKKGLIVTNNTIINKDNINSPKFRLEKYPPIQMP